MRKPRLRVNNHCFNPHSSTGPSELKNQTLSWPWARRVAHGRHWVSSRLLPSSDSPCPHCLGVGQVPGWGQQVADQLLPGSGAQHVLKDTDGLAALCMGREPEAGVGTGSWRKKAHSRLAYAQHWALSLQAQVWHYSSFCVQCQRGMSVLLSS